ncbi:MAG TPA: GFA family protein [Allosphingosinicella sp.]|jgi:hypothetical protein|nr:GFA family protein [Allosphingosinicella sp.]
MERVATCHCGALALECRGEPLKVSLCHCLDCQRRTGSAFSVAVFYPREQVSALRGETASFERGSASGFDVTFRFCPRCGTNLWWEPARLPELVGIAIGGFADSAFPAPEQAVWSKDRHQWLDVLADIPEHAENPSGANASSARRPPLASEAAAANRTEAAVRPTW